MASQIYNEVKLDHVTNLYEPS